MSPSTSLSWCSAVSSYVWQPYSSRGESSIFSYSEILRMQYIHELRLTWLPKDARMPQPVRYKKQYQRTFRGRLFPPGGPKK